MLWMVKFSCPKKIVMERMFGESIGKMANEVILSKLSLMYVAVRGLL